MVQVLMEVTALINIIEITYHLKKLLIHNYPLIINESVRITHTNISIKITEIIRIYG
jgi:hypothetical protein